MFMKKIDSKAGDAGEAAASPSKFF